MPFATIIISLLLDAFGLMKLSPGQTQEVQHHSLSGNILQKKVSHKKINKKRPKTQAFIIGPRDIHR